MTDIYHWWREALQGRVGPIHEDRPQAGRYKMKRNGAFLPVAIGPDGNGNLMALVDGLSHDPLAVWTYCAKHPISQEAYKFRVTNGHWEDEAKPAERSNMPSDPLEALLAEIADKSAAAERMLSEHALIKSQIVCDLFRNTQAELLTLHKRADAMHKEEKAPVLEKSRAIDEKFSFRGAVKVLTERLRQRFETYMKAEERRMQEEARRKFEAERAAAEAERQRIEAERSKLMQDDPIQALTSPEPEMPELPLAPEPVKMQAGGGVGRKAGLKSVWVATLRDADAALKHYAANAKVLELLQKLADADVRGGKRTIPGFEITEDRRAA